VIEKNMEQILSEFSEKKENYERLLEYIKATIKSLLNDRKIRFHEIEGRIKDRESLKGKIEVKDKYTKLSEITDICGIRIITFFSDDVDKIAQLLEAEFSLDKANSIDKRKSQDPTKFGYVSLHYILQLDGSRAELSENSVFKELKFEVQIRTILQHAWAEIEHDFGYKTESEVPEKIRRRFSRLAGLIELADDEFMEIKRTEKVYLDEVEAEIGKQSQSTQIDSVSISALLDSDSFMEFLRKYYEKHNIEVRKASRKFKDERISKIVKNCESLDISTIDELVNKFKENFPNYFIEWIKDKDNYFYVWNITPLLDVVPMLKSD
jgi:region found in relA / spoT proteins family protein